MKAMGNRVRTTLLAGAAAVLWLAAPSTAFAAGGGESSWTLLFWSVANFVIFALIIQRFAWPLIKEYLQDRHDTVVNALEAAAKAKQEAEQLKAEFELRMKSLEDEAQRAQAEVLELAQNEAKKMVEQAEKTAEHIRRDAQLVADQEVARARRELQEESAELVTKIAADLMSAQIKSDDQDRFVKDFLQESAAEAGEGNR